MYLKKQAPESILRVCLFLCLYIGSLLFAEDWSSEFRAAEQAFHSRNQYSCVSLFQALVDKMVAAMKDRALTDSESVLLQRSYDYLGQAFFNRNQQEQARGAFLKLIEINPAYEMNADLISVKVIELVNQLKTQNLGSLTVRSVPTEAKIRIDGRTLGSTDLERVSLLTGDHSVEVSKPGYITQTRSVTISSGAPQEMRFELSVDPESRLYSDAMAELASGDLMFAAGDNAGAEEMYKSALRRLSEIGNKSQTPQALYKLAKVLKLRKDPAADEKFQEALSIARETKNRNVTALILLEIGSMDPAEVENAIAVFHQAGERQNEAKALVLLGDLLSDKRLSLQKYREAANLFQETGSTAAFSQTLIHIGNMQYQMGSAADARKTFEEALLILRRSGEDAGEAEALLGLGQALLKLGDRVTAEKMLQEAMGIFTEKGDVKSAQIAKDALTILDTEKSKDLVNLLQKGFNALNRGDFATAEENYQKARSNAREIGDRASEANALISLGFIYSQRKNDVQAMELWHEAVNAARDAKDKPKLALALFSLATATYTLGDEPGANDLYDQSVTVFKEAGLKPRPRPW